MVNSFVSLLWFKVQLNYFKTGKGTGMAANYAPCACCRELGR